jgi:hypothetical protein
MTAPRTGCAARLLYRDKHQCTGKLVDCHQSRR